MRVAQLTPFFPPHLGGVEFHVKELSEELARRGHDVRVVTTDVPGGSAGCSVDVRRLNALPVPYAPLVPRLSSKLRAAVEGFDVVHSHLPPPFFSAKAPDLPHVLTYHCDFELPPKLLGLEVPGALDSAARSVYRGLYGSVVDDSDAVIATTESYAETSPLLSGKGRSVVPNGVDPERFRFSLDKEPRMLFVGRLSASKGVYDLLDAAPRILDETPVEEVRLVGSGEEERSLRRRAETLDGVTLTGPLGFEELAREYERAACTVLPSKSRLEAFGIVQLESMASGTPVLTSDAPGIREVPVEGETGLLFEPGDPGSLAAAADRLFSMDMEAMGRAARDLVEERYTWVSVADRVEQVYRGVT